MRSILVALALVMGARQIALAQYVFGGCPQPNVTGFVEVPKAKAGTCVAPVEEKGEAARRCGVALGDAKDAVAAAPEVTARITKNREGRRNGIELRAGGGVIARWTTEDIVDCTSAVFMSPDRKTVAVEVRLDERTLVINSNPRQLVVFRLARPVPAPKRR